MKLYKFIGTRFKIPYGAIVKLIKCYPRRKCIVEYNNEQILTFITLLRRINAGTGV